MKKLASKLLFTFGILILAWNHWTFAAAIILLYISEYLRNEKD